MSVPGGNLGGNRVGNLGGNLRGKIGGTHGEATWEGGGGPWGATLGLATPGYSHTDRNSLVRFNI